MKNNILKFLRWVYRNLMLFFNTSLSLIRILIYSKAGTRNLKLKEIKKRVLIFGNGQSIKQVITENIDYLSAQNIMVVNDFFLNSYFVTLKPKVYLLADPGYWETQVTDNMLLLRQNLQDTLIREVNWNMFFIIPTAAYQTGYFQRAFSANQFIHVAGYNATPFEGNRAMRYFFYDRLLAKPYSGNVIGSAIFVAMQMDIEEIFLFGVEHSWTNGLYVDDLNRTCIRIEHFYNHSPKGSVWLKSNSEPYKIHEALFDIANMLGGYREINEYALYKGIHIYNCTPGSFIDAFDRMDFVKIK